MTKLQQKLTELGYIRSYHNTITFHKEIGKNEHIAIVIRTDFDIKKIINFWVDAYIKDDEELKVIKKAYNQMKKDLEVLKEYDC